MAENIHFMSLTAVCLWQFYLLEELWAATKVTRRRKGSGAPAYTLHLPFLARTLWRRTVWRGGRGRTAGGMATLPLLCSYLPHLHYVCDERRSSRVLPGGRGRNGWRPSMVRRCSLLFCTPLSIFTRHLPSSRSGPSPQISEKKKTAYRVAFAFSHNLRLDW